MLNGLLEITHQRKVFGAGLMQADDVAGQPACFGDLVPDVRIIRTRLEQAVQRLFRVRRAVLLEQQIHAHLIQRIVARILGQHPIRPLLGIRQAAVVDVQLDLRQVVSDVVGRLGQQRRQVFPCLLELRAFDLCNSQAVARHIILRVLVQLRLEALGGEARGVFVLQLHPRANQLIAQAVFLATRLGLLGTVAGVGDPRFGDWVRQQEFRWLGIEAVLAHQALEHGRHGARVVTGFFQVEDADAVRFLFVLAGEPSLFLDRGGLGAGNGGDTGITGTGGCRDDAAEQRGHHRDLHALLRFNATGEVALGQVRQFVSQYRGIFAFGLGVEEQAAVHTDNPARRGEGVQLRAVDQDELQAPVVDLAGLHQFVHAGLDVVLELRVVELRDLAPQVSQPRTAQLVFLLWRDNGRTGVAK